MSAPLLAGHCIAITGATGGIGRAVAEVCAREGADLALHTHSRPDEAAALAEELNHTHGIRAWVQAFDLRDAAAVEAGCAQIIETAGRLHGWVNCAGVNRPGLLPMVEDVALEEQLAVNLAAALRCCRAILPHLMQQRGGSIVNVGSVAAWRPSRGQAVYAASKAGLLGMTQALAVEFARKKIRVNAVVPGTVATDMLAPTQHLAGAAVTERVPMGRIGEPREVAEVVAFLLSSRASYMTGACIPVDGGYALG